MTSNLICLLQVTGKYSIDKNHKSQFIKCTLLSLSQIEKIHFNQLSLNLFKLFKKCILILFNISNALKDTSILFGKEY